MANIAANPNNWIDEGGASPPQWWNGTAYVCDDASLNGIGLVMTAKNPVNAGDVFWITFQNYVTPNPEGTTSFLALYSQAGTLLEQWSLVGANGPTITKYTFNGTEGVVYLQAVTSYPSGPFPTYGADFMSEPVIEPVTAPNISVSVPNMASQNITPQIVQNNAPQTGYTLFVLTQPTNGTVAISQNGAYFIYTPTLGQTMVPDSFTYTASINGEVSNVGTVSIFIYTQYNCMCNGDQGEFPSVTMDSLQRRLLVRMGMASMPTPPPGMAEFANDFLMQAQRVLFHKYRVFRSPRWFTWNLQQNQRFYDWTENVEVTSMQVSPPALTVVPSTTGGSVPAGQTTYAITVFNDNGESTPSAPVTVTNTGSTSSNTISWPLTPNIKGVNIYRMAPNGPYGETQLFYVGTISYGLQYIDTAATVTSTQTVPNLNYTSHCPKPMNPRRVLWVGISRGDNVWTPLMEGIAPTDYSPKIQAIPNRFSIRQCIEIWPAPSDDTWQLRILADMNLLPFEQPTDVTSIDPEAILMFALANMKAHYGKEDASAIAQELLQYIGTLVADTRNTHRSWPGKGVIVNAIPPVTVGL